MGTFKRYSTLICAAAFVLAGCAPVERPGDQSVDIPAPAKSREKMKGVNENYQAVTYIPLENDVLVPKALRSDPLPDVYVGPYELRSETLAGALQLILADFDISMAFETEAGLTERITVANLSGRLPTVVDRVCGLADLYCSYKDGLLTVKETETFVVDLPPLGEDAGLDQITTGLSSILGEDAEEPTIDTTTNVVVYEASSRTAKYIEEYFERLRKNTALIVFETHIWEVTLSDANRTGISWTGLLESVGNFDIDFNIPGAAPAGTASPITITPTFNGGDFNATTIFQFISEYGTVKTVSQPQLTVLSGSEATLSVQNSANYVSEVTRTVDDVGDETFSITTDTIDTGLNLTIGSGWDESTVYGTIDITLNELLALDNFVSGDGTTVQLPNTSARSLQTQVRVRPGDAILVAGLVTESDNNTESGPGFMKPLFPTSRLASTDTSELVFLFRPRVLVYETEEVRAKKNRDRQQDEDNDETGLSMGAIPADALAPVAISNPQPILTIEGQE